MNKEEMMQKYTNNNRVVIEQKDSIRDQIAEQIDQFFRLGGKVTDLGRHSISVTPDPTIGSMFKHGIEYASERTGMSVAGIRRACLDGWGPDFTYEYIKTHKQMRFTTAALDAWKPKIKELVKEFS